MGNNGRWVVSYEVMLVFYGVTGSDMNWREEWRLEFNVAESQERDVD